MDGVEHGDLPAAALGIRERPQVVQREHRGVRDLEQAVLELLDRHLELFRHLLVGGGTLELGLELGVRLLDVARPRANRARHPVEGAQLVDDRPLHASDGEGLELDLPIEVETLDRPDQAQQPVRDQVSLLDVRRKPRGHAAGDELDQRRVGDDEPFARPLIALLLVSPPQLP